MHDEEYPQVSRAEIVGVDAGEMVRSAADALATSATPWDVVTARDAITIGSL